MGFHPNRNIFFSRGLTMPRILPINIGILLLSALCLCQSDQQHHPPTPVIGGLCKLDSPDVQIGGKQTQFFLRCEPTPESAPGEGVWVVKSRNAGQTANRIPAAALVNREQQRGEQQPRKSAPKTTTYICDLVSDASEHQFCSTSENCLQPVYMERDAFLQCDSITRRWVKKHCQQGFNFDFERQACIAHTTPVRPGHQFRQFPVALDEPIPSAKSTANSENSKGKKKLNGKKHPNRGIVCTFSDCSIPTAPCNIGTCNNGYCCAFAVGELPTAKFPAEPLNGNPPHLMDQPAQNNAPELASNPPNSTTILPPQSSSSAPPISASMPPSILVIALNEPAPSPPPPTPESLLILDDFPGASFSLQKILGTLQHQQRPFNKPENELCSSGFHSPIRCDGFSSSSSMAGECPPGLACDFGPKLCCPISLPKAKNHQKQFRRVAKWPTNIQMEREKDGPQKRRMSMRRRLARKRFSSFLGGSPMNGWCSPCLPVNFLPTPTQQQQIFTPNLYSANLLSDICPGGVPPLTSCATGGFCAPPLQCVQPGICCAMPAPPPLAPPAYACPGGLPALGQCIAGRCLSPAAVCSSPGNICCAQAIPAAIPATVCPDGTQAAGACVNNQCGTGFTCNQGLCCTNSSQTPRCLDGSQSIGACIQGRCGTGYTCTTGNICCPSQLNPCPPGQVSIGLAVNGRCPTGFTLFNGQCCGTQSNQQSQISCPEIDSTGPCDSNQQCPEPGFACDTANNWCCPQVFENEDAIGPCIQGEGGTRLCPEGYACVGENEGECRRLDTGTCPPEEQLGPCGANNECPAGYECLEGFCCRIDNNTRYRQRRKKRETARTAQSAFLRLVRGMRK